MQFLQKIRPGYSIIDLSLEMLKTKITCVFLATTNFTIGICKKTKTYLVTELQYNVCYIKKIIRSFLYTKNRSKNGPSRTLFMCGKYSDIGQVLHFRLLHNKHSQKSAKQTSYSRSQQCDKENETQIMPFIQKIKPAVGIKQILFARISL